MNKQRFEDGVRRALYYLTIIMAIIMALVIISGLISGRDLFDSSRILEIFVLGLLLYGIQRFRRTEEFSSTKR